MYLTSLIFQFDSYAIVSYERQKTGEELLSKIQFSREKVPLFRVLPELKCNIKQLQSYIHDMGLNDYERYKDLDFGGEYTHLCNQYNQTHRKFVTQEELQKPRCHYNGKKYRQLALTSFDTKQFPQVSLIDPIPNLRHAIRFASNVNSPNYLPQLDERNYCVPNGFAKGIIGEILASFKAKYTRSRLAVLQPGFEGQPHIDYNTSYSIRVHIPIFTNPEALFIYDKDGKIIEQHMPADGRFWAVNTGYTHYVVNRGSTPRLHLVVNLESQEDLWTPSEIKNLVK